MTAAVCALHFFLELGGAGVCCMHVAQSCHAGHCAGCTIPSTVSPCNICQWERTHQDLVQQVDSQGYLVFIIGGQFLHMANYSIGCWLAARPGTIPGFSTGVGDGYQNLHSTSSTTSNLDVLTVSVLVAPLQAGPQL